MSLSTATGTITVLSTDTVGTTKVVTTGFTPNAIFFWCMGNVGTTDTVSNATARYAFGVAASATDRRCVSSISTHAAATIDGGRAARADACLCTNLATSAIDGLLDISSFDASGFTCIIDDQFATGIRVSWFAVGGSDITNAVTGTMVCPIVTGNFDVTTLAFQPDFLLMFGNANTSAAPVTSANRGFINIGAAVSSTNRASVTCGEGPEGNATSQSRSYAFDGEILTNLADTPTAINSRADFVSFLSNGFRLNFLSNGAGFTYQIPYIAIKGGKWWVDNLTTQTDTTTAMVKSGFGFAPAGAMFFSHMLTKSTANTVQAGGYISVGAATDVSNRVAQAMVQRTAQANMDVTQAIEHDEVYANISDSGHSIQGLMDVQSFDSDGFTTIMDDADPSASFVWFFGVGPSVTLTTITVSGAITPTGTILKQDNKLLAGAITPSGLLQKLPLHIFSGSITPSGVNLKKPIKVLAGVFSPSGITARLPIKVLTGAITPTGAILKNSSVIRAGSITPSGGMLKTIYKFFTGSITPIGGMFRTVVKVLLGIVSPSGILLKKPLTIRAGSITPAGGLLKQVFKFLSGSITPSGLLNAYRIVIRSFSGAITPSGVMLKTAIKPLQGVISPTGTLSRAVIKVLSGAITPTATLLKNVFKQLSGVITPTAILLTNPLKMLNGFINPNGALIKTSTKLFSGLVNSTGGLLKKPIKLFNGAVSFTGVLATLRVILLVLTGSVSFAGTLLTNPFKLFSGQIDPVGAVKRFVIKLLIGSITPIGVASFIRARLIVLTGNITPIGALLKTPIKHYSGMITPLGGLLKTAFKHFVGSIGPTGLFTHSKVVFLYLSGAVSFSGDLVKFYYKLFRGSITPVSSLVLLHTSLTTHKIFAMYRRMFNKMR